MDLSSSLGRTAEVQMCVPFPKLSDVVLRRFHVQPGASAAPRPELVREPPVPVLERRCNQDLVLQDSLVNEGSVPLREETEVGALCHLVKSQNAQFLKNCEVRKINMLVLLP